MQYVSMIAQAQKQSWVSTLEQGIAFTTQLAQGAPEVLDKVDFDAALEEGLNMLGVPSVLLRSAQETQQIRQQRAAQQIAVANASRHE